MFKLPKSFTQEEKSKISLEDNKKIWNELDFEQPEWIKQNLSEKEGA